MKQTKCLRHNVISKNEKWENHMFLLYCLHKWHSKQTNKSQNLYLWALYFGSVRWLLKIGKGYAHWKHEIISFLYWSWSFSSHGELCTAFKLHYDVSGHPTFNIQSSLPEMSFISLSYQILLIFPDMGLISSPQGSILWIPQNC